jgi:hypothetical protein
MKAQRLRRMIGEEEEDTVTRRAAPVIANDDAEDLQ